MPARCFERADWVQAAVTAFDAVVKALGDGDRLYHSANGGKRGAQGFADDYAHMARAALHLWEVDRRSALPRAAKRWVGTLNAHFWDDAEGRLLHHRRRRRAADRPCPDALRPGGALGQRHHDRRS